MSERDWTTNDKADAEEFRQHREWWRRPDPFDPANAPDEPAACCPFCWREAGEKTACCGEVLDRDSPYFEPVDEPLLPPQEQSR